MYGNYINNSEFIYVKTDSENKILFAIKKDGNFFFGIGCPQQIKEYIQQKISELTFDEYEDIVSFLGNYLGSDTTLKVMIDGINTSITALDATKLDNEGLDNEALGTVKVVQTIEYIQATTDSENKILEGITNDGKKHISDFDDDTKAVIKEIAQDGGTQDPVSNTIIISQLDKDFTSTVPCVVEGTKGDKNAKYTFTLPLDSDSFNIRFRFRLCEDIISQSKTAVIAKLNNTAIVTADGVSLTQKTSTETYNGEEKTNYWPCFSGGVSFNGAFDDVLLIDTLNQHLGLFAFLIKYTGTIGNDPTNYPQVTIENTGSAFILKINGTTYTYSYNDYPTVNELYEALKSVTDIEVDYREIDQRQCTELAVFSESKLVTVMYTKTTHPRGSIEEYVDAAEFMIPYAVDDSWHDVEIVKVNGTIYCCCDGVVTSSQILIGESTELILGGDCGVVFKDLEIHCDNAYDAEVVDGTKTEYPKVIISSMNPYIIVYEGHGIDKMPSVEAPVEIDGVGNINTTIDRLQYVFSELKKKGYQPVSIYDVVNYYNGTGVLPKRCYTLIFDGFRFVNALDIDNRSVFLRFGAKPSLALTSYELVDGVEYNGETITVEKAEQMCKTQGFDIICHTPNHRPFHTFKPSVLLAELINQNYITGGDGMDANILVYPTGTYSPYLFAVMEWLGYKLGIGVMGGKHHAISNKNHCKYRIRRCDIAMRTSLSSIIMPLIK